MRLREKLKSTARKAVLATAGLAALVGFGGGVASADPIIVDTQPWTSWVQLYHRGPPAFDIISNNGDFYVDGVLPLDIKCGAGLLKNGNIIGHWDNGDYIYGFGNWFGGSVNVDPTIPVPVNYNALVTGERNNGMFGTVDADDDKDWGYLDFWSNGAIDVHADDGELILNQNGFILDGNRADFSGMPMYLGSIDGMENNGQIPTLDFDTSYAETIPVPEPATLVLLGFGLAGLALKKEKKNQGQRS